MIMSIGKDNAKDEVICLIESRKNNRVVLHRHYCSFNDYAINNNYLHVQRIVYRNFSM